MNKSVQQSFSELQKTLNALKNTEERLKGSIGNVFLVFYGYVYEIILLG